MLPGLHRYRTAGGAAMTGLVSGLAPHIESLLAVKHALGLPYTTSGGTGKCSTRCAPNTIPSRPS